MIVVVVFIIILILALKPGKDETLAPWVIGILVALAIGVAAAVNRSRQAQKRRGHAPRPVVSSDSDVVTETHRERPEATSEVESIGRIVEGRFVISDEELLAVRRNPASYSNVIVVEEYVGSTLSASEAKWYLILSPGEAIAVREDASSVWSVAPDGFTYAKRYVISIRGTGGQTQPVTATPVQAAVLQAWKASTWEGFRKSVRPLPRGYPQFSQDWTLVAHYLSTGHDVSPYVGCAPPYGSLKEGLVRLCQNEKDLIAVIQAVGAKEANKRIADLPPELLPSFQRAVRIAFSRSGRRFVLAGCLMTGLAGPLTGIVTYLLVVDPPRKKDLPETIALVCVMGAIALGGIAMLCYGVTCLRRGRG
ncbi:MAG TPA: hypothetical protein PK082_01445 [Phycisphaerae bacterium]|nr:hypothetical protein [Phycisphaerae bacterium]